MKRYLLPILLAAALPAADPRITPAMNAFTVASYKQLQGGDRNDPFPFFNIATALSMALAGAGVRPLKKCSPSCTSIATLLRRRAWSPAYDLPRPVTPRQRIAHRQRSRCKRIRHPAALPEHLANIYHARSRSISSPIPKPPDPKSTAGPKQHTKDKIKGLFPAGSLDARTRLCPDQRHLFLRPVAGAVRLLAHPTRALHPSDWRPYAGQLLN